MVKFDDGEFTDMTRNKIEAILGHTRAREDCAGAGPQVHTPLAHRIGGREGEGGGSLQIEGRDGRERREGLPDGRPAKRAKVI